MHSSRKRLLLAKRLVKIAKDMVGSEDGIFEETTVARKLFTKYVAPALRGREFSEDGFCKVDFEFDFKGIRVGTEVCVVRLSKDGRKNAGLKRRYPNWMLDYPAGQGDSQPDENTVRIAIYGENGIGRDFYRDTFVHEMLHAFDNLNDRFCEEDYGHPYPDVPNNEENNFGIPYPGMPGKFGKLPLTDSHYAEYFTCKAERREYIVDLKNFIRDFSRKKRVTQEETCRRLRHLLDDRNAFEEFIEGVEGNNSPLFLLYHLAFSKNSNGTLSDAHKILDLISKGSEK